MARVAESKTFVKGPRRSTSRGAFGLSGRVLVVTNNQAIMGLVNRQASREFTRSLADRAVELAKDRFLSLVVHSHAVTPPPYATSFFVTPRDDGGYIFGNRDPASMWVEFGTHPGGGKTRTLGYRPIGYAIDRLSGNALNGDFNVPGKGGKVRKKASRLTKFGKRIGRKRKSLRKAGKRFKRIGKRIDKRFLKSLGKPVKVRIKTGKTRRAIGRGLKRTARKLRRR